MRLCWFKETVPLLKGFGFRLLTVEDRKLEHGFRRIHAVIPYTLYFKGMRLMMFQLSGFYCRKFEVSSSQV